MRVSTQDQSLDTQIESLKKYGLKDNEVYKEKDSGRNDKREVLNSILMQLRPGDEFVVEQLSRFGRSLSFVYKQITYFSENDIKFVSIKENLDITSPFGKAMVAIIIAFRQMESEVQNEKIKQGLKIASKTKKLGRPRIKESVKVQVIALRNQGYSISEVSEICKIGKRTVSTIISNHKKLS